MAGEFRLLGGIEVCADGQPIAVSGARQQGILAVLLTEVNRPVPAEQLITRVWGAAPPRRPANAVSAQLKLLRRALAPVAGVSIRWQPAGYRFTIDQEAIDLHLFRSLLTQARAADDEDHAASLFERAFGLWRGEPFAGLDTRWFDATRAVLARERHAAQLEFTDLQLRRGQHTVLLTGLADQTHQHPLDERLAGQFMLALYRSGRPSDALQHYQQTRAQLAEELGTDPSPLLHDLHQQILTTDPRLAGPAPTAGIRRPPTPRQLPAPPRSFTGRARELAALTAVLDTAAEPGRTVVISAIAGAGGIGKTSLALQWAHQHLDLFPDGQLFIDLRGYRPTGKPMSTGSAMRMFLYAFGVEPTQIPPGLHAQAALLRSLVAGKRMLIMLDNAVDTNQVRPLLPGSPTCTVIVTSRDHLASLVASNGAHHLPVDVLSAHEARAMLSARLGAGRLAAEADAGDELLAYCGGYPLALSIVAGRAHTHPHLPLATLAAELRTAGLDALDEDDPAVSLPAVLSWSYRTLTDEQARVFCLLGIAPGPDISLAAAASLTGLPTGDARVVLRGLERASLLHQDIPGRWRMHDLIRHYATDRAGHDVPDADREAAFRQVLDFYLHTVYSAARLLEPHREPIQLDAPAPGCHPHPLPNHAAAIDWFDDEHLCLLATQPIAAAHGWHQHVWRMTWALHSFLWRRGHSQDHLVVWRAGVTAADHLGEPAVQVLTRQLLGHTYARVGRYDEALEHLQHALAMAEHADDVPGQAYVHRVLGWAWERRGDDWRAQEHYNHALHIFQALGMPVWEADMLNSVGWNMARLGEYEQARAFCETALTLLRRHHHTVAEADTLDSLGYIAHHSGKYVEAINHYQQALTLFRDLGDLHSEAATLNRLGHPHLALGHDEQTRVVWREALKLYQAQQRIEDVKQIQQQLDALDGEQTDDLLG